MAKFNKRHYQAIAEVMQSCKPQDGYSGAATLNWTNTRLALADMFAADNHLFNRDLFAQACQPGQNVRAKKVTLYAKLPTIGV